MLIIKILPLLRCTPIAIRALIFSATKVLFLHNIHGVIQYKF